MRKVGVDKGVAFGDGKLVFIAGPCVIESRAMALGLASRLVALARRLGVGLVFKASFDKANRTSVDSFRGPGIDAGLDILAEIRET
ncbi:MAG: 3-deoxy-8-phosphooctulonate synthase, partial [Kiritimatiellae bacterium]|nr:3-deoxy-8-phosphooctulonate synthase [Kiritimatiellia bacterium]